MKNQKSDGFGPKIFSVIILMGLIFLLTLASELRFLVKAIPIVIAPFILIWFPESAAGYVSTHTSEQDIRRWGVAGLLLLAVPLGIAFRALR